MSREFDIELYETIDKYLNNSLSESEKEAFERRMQEDDALLKEVEETREMILLMEEHHSTVLMKAKMDDFHEELVVDPLPAPKSKPRKKRYIVQIAIAASISAISVFSSLWSVGYFNQNKKEEINQYVEMVGQVKDNVDKIIESQDSLSKEVKEFLDQKNKPLVIYRGTGFPINQQGYMVTNYHVVKAAKKITVQAMDKTYSAQLIDFSYKHDIAILKLDDIDSAYLENMPFRLNTQNAQIGEGIYTLGYPKQDMVYGDGAISSESGYHNDTTEYQISIPINPGNSGSPIFNENGEIIGIVKGKNSLKVGTSYALKSKYIYDFIDKYNSDTTNTAISFGYKPTYLGSKRSSQIKSTKDYIFKVSVIKNQKKN